MAEKSNTAEVSVMARDESRLHEVWERGLPDYLQNDLDAYKRGLERRSTLLDCLWGELSGSINGAEIDDQAITREHAEYLREKYLRRAWDART